VVVIHKASAGHVHQGQIATLVFESPVYMLTYWEGPVNENRENERVAGMIARSLKNLTRKR